MMEDSPSPIGVLSLRSSIAFSLLSAASSGIHQRLVRRRKMKESAGEGHTKFGTKSANIAEFSPIKPDELADSLPSHLHQRPAPLIPPAVATPHVWGKVDDGDAGSDSSSCADDATTCSSTSLSSDEPSLSCPGTPIHRSPVPYFLPASVPTRVAIGVTVGLALAWVLCTGWRARMRFLLQAALFAIIEFHFTGLTDTRAKRYWPPAQVGAWKSSGRIALEKIAHALHLSMSMVPAPITRVWRTGYTTWEMFGATVLWMPIFSELYFRILFPGDSWFALGCRVLFYPVNVWVMETAVGYFLSRVWGRRAWWYQDTWARFDGNITLGYGHYWLVMGAVHNLSYWHCELPFTEAVGDWLGVA